MLVLRNKDLLETTKLLAVNINGGTLSNVSLYKYLGVDRNLSYDDAVHKTYVEANKKLFTLRKIRPYITHGIAALVYKQFILTILDYADFLVESASTREINLMDKIQERALLY